MKSNSHLDKFTGIYDMNGKPICNGDKIRVHDNDAMKFKKGPIVGTVIWKNGNYQFKGNHWCEYNIYAWRKSVEVLESGRESVYENSTIDEWESKNLNFTITDRVLIRKAFKDGFVEGVSTKEKSSLTIDDIYKADIRGRMNAFQYVIDFYEILDFNEIVKQRDLMAVNLKRYEEKHNV
jgi:hypothetical protein